MKTGFDLTKARTMMEQQGLDLLIASSLPNLFYTSGLFTLPSNPIRLFFVFERLSPCMAVISLEREPFLILPTAAAKYAAEASWIQDVRLYSGAMYVEGGTARASGSTPMEVLVAALGPYRQRVGVEEQYVAKSFVDELSSALPQIRLVGASAVFSTLRMLKSPEEVGLIRDATVLTEQSIMAGIGALREGISELEVHQVVKRTILDAGGDWFNFVVSVGKNSADPFHISDETLFHRGETFRFDIGACWQGYASDLGRIAALGEPPERLLRLHQVLLEAQVEAMKVVKPGAKVFDIFNAGQDYVRAHGYPNYTRGSLGHGVGVEAEEQPIIGPNNHTLLQPNMVLAVEIPYYIAGVAGLNVEDILRVTETGYEFVSRMERKLFVV